MTTPGTKRKAGSPTHVYVYIKSFFIRNREVFMLAIFQTVKANQLTLTPKTDIRVDAVTLPLGDHSSRTSLLGRSSAVCAFEIPRDMLNNITHERIRSYCFPGVGRRIRVLRFCSL